MLSSGIVVLSLALLSAIAIRYIIVFPRQSSTGDLPQLDDAHRALALRLEDHIRAIASKPHNLDDPPALEAAALYIEHALDAMGHRPLAQHFIVGDHRVRNIEVIVESAAPPAATLVIGAHYDSAQGTPGANDNATGVAALLELARNLKSIKPQHRLRLVFFVNEEAPYGKTPDMGSYQHAKALRAANEHVTGMFALETLGYFSSKPGSQRFPFPFGLFYPDRGDFIAFIGMPRARTLVHRSLAAFRAATPFPAVGCIAPSFIQGADLSDHWAYNHFGYPAVMLTDTAPFRNPFYHSPSDTPDTVDYVSLARITNALTTTIAQLAKAPA